MPRSASNLAMASEVEEFLDAATTRPVSFTRTDGSVHRTPVLVIVGARFAPLWGEAAIDPPPESEAWQLADKEPLADAAAVAAWLVEHSRLPAGILRRLSPEPLVLRRINREEAQRLAVRLRDNLPPALDGIGADEFGAALHSPHGWHAVSALIEAAWLDGHAMLPVPQESASVPVPQELPPAEPPTTSPCEGRLPVHWARPRQPH